MTRSGFILGVVVALAFSASAEPPSPSNSLTDAERAEGWRLLFDGATPTGWRGFKQAGFPSRGWKIEEGCLHHVGSGGGGDIVTAGLFDDYDFVFDWKIGAGGNSGVKYFITEDRKEAIGHEYQLIATGSGEGSSTDLKHATASFYDVLPPSTHSLPRPPGEWNHSRILVRGNHVEHWLNGQQVLSYELDSPAVKGGIASSKFRKVEGFGTHFPHRILLQDHGGDVWFRNLKLRPLKAGGGRSG